jgi:hypothetical protein
MAYIAMEPVGNRNTLYTMVQMEERFLRDYELIEAIKEKNHHLSCGETKKEKTPKKKKHASGSCSARNFSVISSTGRRSTGLVLLCTMMREGRKGCERFSVAADAKAKTPSPSGEKSTETNKQT